MSRLLAQIDPNLPPLSLNSPSSSSSTSSSPSSDTMLPSPSKEHPKPDRMKEWTFPRSSSSSNSPLVAGSSSSSHGRSSSIVNSKSSRQQHHESSLTKDLRHRSNFSLVHPGTPDLSQSPTKESPSRSPLLSTHHSHSASRTTRGGGGGGGVTATGGNGFKSTKSLNDLIYFVVFGGAFVLFATSLFGVGYKAPSTPAASDLARTSQAEMSSKGGVILENVEIAKGFMEEEGDEKVPADVYQSVGDSSHDRGRDFVRDSPDDPRLDDENVHKTYHPEADSALFPHVDHPAQLDDSNLHRVHEQNRPRPARLPSLQDQEEEEEEESIRRGGHDHDGHAEDHESLEEDLGEDDEYTTEEEDADDDEHGSEGHHSHGGEETDEEGDLVDDTISIHGSPLEEGEGEDGDDGDDGESLTALEELLLDADMSEEAEPLTPEEEEAQHLALQYRRPVGDAEKGGDTLERLRREREELGRARERWEAKMRAGEKDDEEIDEDDESWTGSGELRRNRMLKRIRR
ncbi:hypothetical protein JCM3765_005556 [Sporobolomyces pararoseus]